MEELIQAVSERNYIKVQQLLIGGADVNAKDRHDWSPMFLAVRNDDLKMVMLLYQQGARIDGEENPMPFANSGVMIDLLVQLGASPHVHDETGRTRLHHAGSEEEVEALIRYGLDINAVSTDGRTALCDAIGNHASGNFVAYLIDHGAEVPAPKSEWAKLVIEWLEGTDPRRDDLIRKVQNW